MFSLRKFPLGLNPPELLQKTCWASFSCAFCFNTSCSHFQDWSVRRVIWITFDCCWCLLIMSPTQRVLVSNVFLKKSSREAEFVLQLVSTTPNGPIRRAYDSGPFDVLMDRSGFRGGSGGGVGGFSGHGGNAGPGGFSVQLRILKLRAPLFLARNRSFLWIVLYLQNPTSSDHESQILARQWKSSTGQLARVSSMWSFTMNFVERRVEWSIGLLTWKRPAGMP